MDNSPIKRRKLRKPDKTKWWTQGFDALDAGNKLRIVPFWDAHKIVTHRIPIIIDPGPAFGLGDHPTTIMALELLELAMQELSGLPGCPTVLDVGAGVGVLSIASRFLGAGSAIALDIDPIAVHVANRNFINNKVKAYSKDDEGVLLCLGGIECVSGSFSLVMANLVAPLLLRIKKPLSENSQNLLLLSGMFESMFDDVKNAYTEEGFVLVDGRSRGEWRSCLFRRAD